ncbi:MAG: disulfide bond formation protein B [Anaerolineae bacterium]|nr:disulfide bond formation protein B [Anaerolineae bacterium]
MVEKINSYNAVPTSSIPRWNQVREKLLYITWTQALIATLGSLFFSEVMGFIPCVLCWYQRILMYPLVIILGVGILLQDRRVRIYVLPLSILGIGIGLYHNLLYYGTIPEGFHICTSGVPCEARWIEWLGFIGIPLLSFTAFTIITLCLLWYQFVDTDEEDAPSSKPIGSNRENGLKGISALLGFLYATIIIVGISSRIGENTQGVGNSDRFSTNSIIPKGTTAFLSPNASYSPEVLGQGQQVFNRQCSPCHGQKGEGIPNLGLTLVDNAFIQENTDTDLLEFIKVGRLTFDPENQTGMAMPGKGGNITLTDSEILAVIAYLRSLNQ